MKIKIQNNRHQKAHFSGLVPSSTTLNFGEPSITFCKEIIPETKISFNIKNFCRTGVLKLPTFGDYKLLTNVVFVPFSSLFRPFDSLLTKTQFGSKDVNTIPYFIPSDLISVLFQESLVWSYTTKLESVAYTTQKLAELGLPMAEDMIIIGSDSRPTEAISYGSDIRYVLGENISGTTRTTSYLHIQLSSRGRAFAKILQGLGYPVNLSSTKVSALPLICYAKAVFDTFSPQQSDTKPIPFKNTTLYGFILQMMSNPTSYKFDIDSIVSIRDFILDNCFYYNDDFISLHNLNQAITPANLGIKMANADRTNVLFTNTSTNAESQTPFTENNVMTSDRFTLIQRLGKLIKQNTIIGGKLSKLLNIQYNKSESDSHDSIMVKSYITDLGVSDIFSTVNSQESVLGEYGGRMLGSNDFSCTFENKSNDYGYIFVFSTLYFNRSYFDGSNPDVYHVNRDDFYNSIYDSLGYQISPKSVYSNPFARNSSKPEESFGFRPRYSEYKFFKPIVSGDFISKRYNNNILAFIGNAYKSSSFSSTELASYSLPVFSKELNKLADKEFLYNGNHIFYSDAIQSDNNKFPKVHADPVVLHALISVNMYAPMLPVSESFETSGATNNESVNKE